MKQGSLKEMRRALREARQNRSLKKAIAKLQVAQREANMIRFGPGDFTEEERREAFGVSEILMDTFAKWMLAKYVITKADVNEVTETFLEE